MSNANVCDPIAIPNFAGKKPFCFVTQKIQSFCCTFATLCKNKIRKDEKYPLVSWKLKTFFANLRDEKNSFINLIKRQSVFLTAEAVLDTYCTN